MFGDCVLGLPTLLAGDAVTFMGRVTSPGVVVAVEHVLMTSVCLAAAAAAAAPTEPLGRVTRCCNIGCDEYTSLTGSAVAEVGGLGPSDVVSPLAIAMCFWGPAAAPLDIALLLMWWFWVMAGAGDAFDEDVTS